MSIYLYSDSHPYPWGLACHPALFGWLTIFSNSPNTNYVPHCPSCKPHPLWIPVTDSHPAPSCPLSTTFIPYLCAWPLQGLSPCYTEMPCSSSLFKLGNHKGTYTEQEEIKLHTNAGKEHLLAHQVPSIWPGSLGQAWYSQHLGCRGRKTVEFEANLDYILRLP